MSTTWTFLCFQDINVLIQHRQKAINTLYELNAVRTRISEGICALTLRLSMIQ